MARTRYRAIEEIIDDAVAGVVSRAVASIEAAFARQTTDEVKSARSRKPGRATSRGRRRVGRREMTKWVADLNARRVPNFVIDATGGLNTKKAIVAKFGPNAAFEKGKPLPPLKAGTAKAGLVEMKPVQVVKARAPIVRKKTAAAPK